MSLHKLTSSVSATWPLVTSVPPPTRNRAIHRKENQQETKHDLYIIGFRDETIHQILNEGVEETKIKSDKAYMHTNRFSKTDQ